MTQIDPVCLFHGKKWSEHEGGRCLFCALCFDTDPPSGWWRDEEGTAWDICNECKILEDLAAEREKATRQVAPL